MHTKLNQSMFSSLNRGRQLLRQIKPKYVLFGLLPVAAIVSFVAIGQSSPPSIPAVNLSADPLYAPSTSDKPLLALALSVEFPTVGAQYLDPANNTGGATSDGSYSNSSEYLGYYDAESCYEYTKGPKSGETPVAPLTTHDYKRFDRTGPATGRMCTGEKFSGNFLNWASSSAIDMLRLALTGGDRYVDTPTMTILQRAVLPDGSPRCFWNTTNFPAKRLLRSGGTSGTAFFGAVPETMRETARLSSNDIWIGNRLNRIYFRNGSTATGSCTDQSGYTLGGPTAPPPASGVGTVTYPFLNATTALPTFQGSAGYTVCPHTLQSGDSGEGESCSFSGTKEVLYGAPPNSRPAAPGNPGGWLTYVATGGVTCGNPMTSGKAGAPTDGDPISGVYKRCYYRDYTPPDALPASTSLNEDGFFYARVQVCDRDPSTYALKDVRDYGLCRQYSDGATTPRASFKPTGAIQKYANQLRIAAFGYLMDQVDTRYGGVLRAPAKYVGEKTYDTSGVQTSSTNPNMEWNATTGVFIADPDGPTATYAKSGVINYVNQFGRTGPVPGRYKIYDPFSELHYETLRYLQGLAPSASAISGITSDMYDGFPVATTWTDPYGGGRSATADYSCLKSNIVMIGDKNTNDRSGRLPAASATNNIPDIAAWSTTVQNFEKKASSAYLDGLGNTQNTNLNPNTANSNPPSGVQASIMGTAYWARTHDIRGTGWTGTGGPARQRPGLRVKTFMFDVNEFSQSTDNATRRTTNQLFMAAKYGGFETDAGNAATNMVAGKSTASTYNTKGNPFYQDDLTTADQYVWQDTDPRASRVGEANTYFLQSDARSVLSAFDDIFRRASTAARSIAGGAIQSKSLTQVGGIIYQGTFDTSDWSGDLLAIPVNVSSSNVVSLGTTFNWTAAARLAALTSPATSRKIFVGNSGATSNPVAVPFLWADIGLGLQTALNKINPTATADGLGEDRLNYLRGDKSKENSPFRPRSKLLGDIINSGVVYSGAPTTSINETGYGTFYATNKNRTSAVFVGANDGMLHAFNGATGDELFAYIPSWLGGKLSALTDPTYVTSHQSYLDGTPVVAEALVGSDWKTVLVAGTGGGGKGVFALDVTDPSTFTAGNALWEFTEADDADVGFVTGRPQILKLKTSATSATYKYFAVFGSGVNNYRPSAGGVFSTTGNPTLFLLDLGKAPGSAWALGTNFFKVSLPVDSSVSGSMATGLLNFRAALGTSREVTQMYMGDLHGNLWKLDFTGKGTSDWNMGSLSYFKQGTSDTPIPMFIATDGSGASRDLDKRQPISAAPSLVYGPIPDSTYVLFSTGKYLEVADKSDAQVQSAYMVYDNATNTPDTTPTSSAVAGVSDRRRLKQGSVSTSTKIVTVPAFTLGRGTSNTDSSNPRSGWYFNFPYSKERSVSNATVVGADQLVFGTLIPGVTTTSACAASGGGGNDWLVNVLTGNGNYRVSTVGVMGEPLVADVTSATTYTPSDSTGRRIKTITSAVIKPGSDDINASGTVTRNVVTGRLTWRQINSYQELKNAP